VCVEGADANDDVGCEAETLGPFGGKAAGGLIAGESLFPEAGGEAFEKRVEG